METIKDNIINVPSEFMKPPAFHYPEDNEPIFERWYWKNHGNIPLKWNYLPIQWTAYYVNNNFGKNIDQLQEYLNTLDKSKRYYTIIQYDDGILNDVSQLNLFVFAMSGPHVDYPLPLICHPHRHITTSTSKDLFCCYIGKPTHPCRELITSINEPEYYISSKKHNMEQYCNIIERSVFALCPRGYGQSSFRICEVIQYGTIPVYISDEFIIPHEKYFKEYGVLIKYKSGMDLQSKIISTLKSFTRHEIRKKQELLKRIYQEYFTFSGTQHLINQKLKHID